MKCTLNWLKEHLDTAADLPTISEKLTAIGLEVEEITDAAADLKDFTVAEILHAEQHPNADKLKVCKVKSAKGELQIVCGAPNARAGIKVALATVGTVIPNGDFKIKKSNIRGVESCGMMCSARELNLGDDHAGIIELPETAEVGQPIVDVLGLHDPVIEIAITPNRGDCLGVYGIARDLAAAGIGTLKPLDIKPVESHDVCPVSITIKDDNCKQFVGCAIKGVQNGPSPEWLQQRLKAIGLRPISTLVDITNFITFAYGRPLHVYDMAKLTGGITVRPATKGERFDALNDKSYTLNGGECVIADDAGVLGIAGIVGGVPSGVTDETKDVLLECAWFEPAHIAYVGRTLSVDSDARYRFERTVDPAFVVNGATLAVAMIVELCGGTPSQLNVAGDMPEWKRSIDFDPVFTNQLGGVIIPDNQQKTILTSLGFEVNGKQLTPPSWRPDVEGKADIAEEVLRIYGYDNVPSAAMPKLADVSPAAIDVFQKNQSISRRTLAARGLHETHTWAFLSEAKAKLFGGGDEALTLMNPISSDLGVMRPNLLPNLLEALARNHARGSATANLFELGPQFDGIEPKGQKIVACAVRSGPAEAKQWSNNGRPVDCFDAKADALAVLEACGLDVGKVQAVRQAPEWYHPGRSGALCLGPKNVLAYFGELHPLTLQVFDCEFTVVACEVMIDAIPQPKKKQNAALKSSDFQHVERDFAFVVDADKPADELLRAIKGADKQLIQRVRLFDVYQGKGLEENQKSLALSIRLQATDRTLKEEEIDSVAKNVVAAAEKIGAKLRA